MKCYVVSRVYLLLIIAAIPTAMGGDQYDNLIKRANIFYLNPLPGSEKPEVRIKELNEVRSKENIKIVIHGYQASKDHVAVAPLRNAYLSKGFDSLYFADWSDASDVFYFTSRYFVKRVGIQFSKILENFLRKHSISPQNVHLIGHSLGAHIAGVIGKYFNGTIGRITGLDPALPLFENAPDVLKSSYAQFVDVIHTDVSVLGFLKPLGHVDFYPNYGYAPQPGCKVLDLLTFTSCSHYRAPIFYAESVRLQDNFPSVTCPIMDIKKFNAGKCFDSNEPIVFMGEQLSPNVRGQFYLDTNNVPPYGFGAFSKAYQRQNDVNPR